MFIFDQIPASGTISTRARLFAIVGSFALATCMGFLIRKRLLKPAYSLLWLLMSIIIVVLAVFSDLLFFISQILGIYYVPATLFLLALMVIFLVALHFSLVITRLEKRLAELTQIIGLQQFESKSLSIKRGKKLLVKFAKKSGKKLSP